MTPLLSTAVLRTQSDKRLAALARAGHEVAFEAIVERYRPQLRRYCLRLVPESRADDALQQAFLLAWTALQDGPPVRELRPWLYAVVHNAAVGQLRRGVFDYVELADTLEGAEAADDDVARRTEARETLAAVAALPSRQRAALLAVALDGRPQAEVAHEMGLTGNGLRQLLFRARTTVRATATAFTPLPALEALLGAGTVGGGALPAGTALVVAGSLAVGGAVGLRTPAVRDRAGVAPALAATPTAAPLAARRAPTTTRTARVRVVRRAATPTSAPHAHRVLHVVLLRGRHGLRVAAPTTPRRTAVAPAPQPATALPPAAPPPAASAPAPAAVAAVNPEPTAAAGDDATATAPPAAAPSPAPVAAPRAGRDGHDDGDDNSDDGSDDGED